MNEAVNEFLNAMHLKRVTLAGNSWSGGWALAYEQTHPRRVARLILLAPSGLAEPDPVSWEILKLPIIGRALTNLEAGSRAQVAAGVRALFVHKQRVTSTIVDAMWAPNTLPDNLRATYELEARLNWSITQSALPSTRQPTLIIWGRQDTVLPVWQAGIFAKLMPAAKVHVLNDCGHALTLDCPDRVIALMNGYLGDS
jgi:4,5:9,10-diseco-3-hydroxy-5,9,17-trioxoandrosta-1(10),2-diene-4-oate hydrolase